MGEGSLDGKDVVDRRTHLGNAVRQAAGAHSETKAKDSLPEVACTPSEPKLSLAPALQAQRQVYLTRGVVETTREAKARARAEPQVLEVALQPDADVLGELTGHGMAQATQGPAAVPAEPSTGSVAQASSASEREIESRELGDMGAF